MEKAVIQTPDGSVVEIPPYSGTECIDINGGKPFFLNSDFSDEPFIMLSELDSLGRCGGAMMCAHSSLLPKEKRGSMKTRPSGWHQNKYEILKSEDNPAGYLMCRAHLLPYCLTGILDEERNLISSTFYMNGYTGMEEYEMQVLSYIKSNPDKKVLYRVSPVLQGDNLFANGVLMEAKSMDDDSIEFCKFIYNVQPGIVIDYKTGKNWEE